MTVLDSSDLPEFASSLEKTPRRVLLEDVARERLHTVAERTRALSTGRVRVQPCYSFKTDPEPRLVEIARENGWFAEVISPEEHAWARECGFADEHTIYNGPRPLVTDRRIFAAFADSMEAFVHLREGTSSEVFGARLRPPDIPSRFGIDIPDDIGDLVESMRATPRDARLGVSFHLTRSEYERRTWFEFTHILMQVAADIEQRSDRRHELFDVGGGWTQPLLELALEHEFPRMIRALEERLPAVRMVLLEPGQSITRSTQAVVATVLEVRGRRNEIVIDAGFSDMPQAHDEPPPVSFVREGRLEQARPGAGRVLGPYCVEYDIVASISRYRRRCARATASWCTRWARTIRAWPLRLRKAQRRATRCVSSRLND